MANRAGQQRDTKISLDNEITLGFGQILEVLVRIYRVQPATLSKFTARIKKVQREGIPLGANVGKGPRARYSLDQFFQLIFVLELAELSMSLTTASRMVRNYWPDGPLSLAPAHAWLMHIGTDPDDDDTLLVLASASEIEGFAHHSDIKEAATAQARAFLVSKPAPPMDNLSPVLLSRLMNGKHLNLGSQSLLGPRWRSSLIDCSTLIPLVVKVLEELALVTPDQFTLWAKSQCEAFSIEA